MGKGAAMSVADLVPDALLGGGQRVGQRGAQAGHQAPGAAKRDAPGARGARAQDGEAELQEQEVVEGQPAVRRPPARPPSPGSGRRAGRRRGQGAGGARAPASGSTSTTSLGDARPRASASACAGRAGAAPRSSSRWGRAARRAAARRPPAPPAPSPGPGWSAGRDGASTLPCRMRRRPRVEGAGQVAAGPEERGHREAAVVAQHGREGRTGARRRRADAHDHAGAGAHVAGAQLAKRGETGPVLVADGDEEEGVLDGVEALARPATPPAGVRCPSRTAGASAGRGRPPFASPPASVLYNGFVPAARRRRPRSVHGPAM